MKKLNLDLITLDELSAAIADNFSEKEVSFIGSFPYLEVASYKGFNLSATSKETYKKSSATSLPYSETVSSGVKFSSIKLIVIDLGMGKQPTVDHEMIGYEMCESMGLTPLSKPKLANDFDDDAVYVFSGPYNGYYNWTIDPEAYAHRIIVVAGVAAEVNKKTSGRAIVTYELME
ncbi:hypothetical protein Sf12_gp59 [Shigella phage Sf12]|uniref:Uncharacterized protein n=1 Tax=Shigella phage Sf12 TaxID=2024315 RepID=A0A291AXP8_9CAUD|nr:hypothetical protein HOR99_gp58 [Shigella phage Sf12]ATE85785.1 hypothetical protein Sf12_gp59 [Shigella phage Sf12]